MRKIDLITEGSIDRQTDRQTRMGKKWDRMDCCVELVSTSGWFNVAGSRKETMKKFATIL